MTCSVVAVVTLAHGRHAHLRAQLAALAAGTRLPDIWVGAAMDDELLESVVRHQASSSRPADKIEVVHLPRRHGHLPLAAARNAAAARAIAMGTDPARLPRRRLPPVTASSSNGTPRRPRPDGEQDRPDRRPRRSSPVPSTTCRRAAPVGNGTRQRPPPVVHAHPARPVPGPGRGRGSADDPLLFWSLSFAITTQDWLTLGGFDEDYEGYGGEDTDFAMRLTAHDGRLLWVGGATCYHQHHDGRGPAVDVTSRTSSTTATGSTTRWGSSSRWVGGWMPSPPRA